VLLDITDNDRNLLSWSRSPICLFCLYNLFNKYYATIFCKQYIVTRKLKSFTYKFNLSVTMQYKLTLICDILIKLQMQIYLKNLSV